MYKLGDYVRWITSVKGKSYERAGEIIAEIPAGKDPKKYIPSNFVLHIRGKPRDTVSFLVKIPGFKTLYWPPMENLGPLPLAEWELLYSQHIYMKPRKLEGVSQKDRETLIALCNLLGDIYYENQKMLTVPAWGRRFYFKTVRGSECIYKTEDFVSVIRGKQWEERGKH